MIYRKVLHENVIDLVDPHPQQDKISPIKFAITFENIEKKNCFYTTFQIPKEHAEDHRNTGFSNRESVDFI